MNGEANALVALRARILRVETDQPVQVVMSPKAAADLASIADAFAMHVAEDSDEAARLVRVAAAVSARLRDCLAALDEEEAE